MATKPKLALIPSAYKASKLYSVLPADGVGDFDFSRPTTATRVNQNGLIETVGSNVPRLNYPLIEGEVSGCPSLLLEPSRTNLLPYSQDFSNVAWLKNNVTIISNSIISPDGSLNADELQVTSSAGNIYDNIGNSGDGVFSVFAKYKDTQFIRLRSTGSYAYFDIKNGVVGSTINTLDAKIENYGNGWYRCSVIGNNTNSLAQIFVSSDGVNVGLGNVYLWGADFQMGSYPTSYIPTNGNTVTRVAETCNGSGDASTFNDSEGVLFAEISALDSEQGTSILSINDSTTSNRVSIYYSSTANNIQGDVVLGGVVQASFNYTLVDSETLHKVAFSYKENDFKVYINGLLLVTDTSGSTFSSGTLTKLAFDAGNGTFDWYGKTKQIQYFDTALNDTDLEELTSWKSFSEMARDLLYTIQ